MVNIAHLISNCFESKTCRERSNKIMSILSNIMHFQNNFSKIGQINISIVCVLSFEYGEITKNQQKTSSKRQKQKRLHCYFFSRISSQEMRRQRIYSQHHRKKICIELFPLQPSLYKRLRNFASTHFRPTRCNNIVILFMRVNNRANLKLSQFFLHRFAARFYFGRERKYPPRLIRE